MWQEKDTLIQIAWMALLAFFSAFSKELNDFAKGESENFLVFLSEILLNGVCGIIVGMMTLSFVTNTWFVLACSAVGGLLGMTAVKAMFKIIMIFKNIDMSNISLEDEPKSKPNKKKRR